VTTSSTRPLPSWARPLPPHAHVALRDHARLPDSEERHPSSLRRALRAGRAGIVRFPPSELLDGNALVSHRCWPEGAPEVAGDVVWALWAEGGVLHAAAHDRRWKGLKQSWLGEMLALTPFPSEVEGEVAVRGLVVERGEGHMLRPAQVIPAEPGDATVPRRVAWLAARLDADQRSLLSAHGPVERGDLVRGLVTTAVLVGPFFVWALLAGGSLAWTFGAAVGVLMGTTTMWRRHRVLDEQGAEVTAIDVVQAAQIRRLLRREETAG
jgi:hypothetical protein